MPENSPNQPMVSIVVPVYKAERFFQTNAFAVLLARPTLTWKLFWLTMLHPTNAHGYVTSGLSVMSGYP